MTPVEASKKKNESAVYYKLYGDMKQLSSKPKFKIGDKVRISKDKRKVFDKGYKRNWTEEIFLVDKIQSRNPITYRLKDLNNEEIEVTSWLVSADDFSSRVARGANERVSAANE